jgi:hypothetical protein
LVLALLWLACCGGKVIVDGAGTAAATAAAGGSATTGSTSNDCAGVDPSTLSLQSGSWFDGEPDGDSCTPSYTDNHGNIWEEVCTQGACKCMKNGEPVCSCVPNTTTQSCNSVTQGCCFGL